MKPLNIRHYLRQNKNRKNGVPGSYSIRLLWLFSKTRKPKRIERGLATNDLAEAEARAYVLLRFIYSLGHKVSNRIHVSVPGRKSVPLSKAVQREGETLSDLPLFANLPPFQAVDTTDKTP